MMEKWEIAVFNLGIKNQNFDFFLKSGVQSRDDGLGIFSEEC